MTLITFSDRLPAGNVRRTADGFLVADAKVARTGIQEYLGSELGRPDMGVVRVFRPESSVFSQDVMHSYAYRPMTNDHPGVNVTADNWKDLAVGSTGGDVVRDGEWVRVPLTLMDAAAIKDYEAGKRELSMGYTAEIKFQDGVTPDGQQYDAVMGPARMNHLALVDKARGGTDLRIGDRGAPESKSAAINDGGQNMDPKLQVVMVDGISISVTDQGAQVINNLQKALADARNDMQNLKDDHAKVLATKDSDLAKAQASLDDAKSKVLTDAQIDALIAKRADLITQAKSVHDADYSGKSESDIRKAAVLGRLGDAFPAARSGDDAYIAARFDILVEDAADPLRTSLRDGAPVITQSVNDNGQMAYDQRQANAWKGVSATK